MYGKNETPIIRASLYYYDDIYPAALGTGVREILEQYGFSPPDRLYADRLTGGEYQHFEPEMADLFPRGYSEKGIFSISMASADSAKATEYWKFDWNFTFHKSETLAVTPTFRPWNVLFLDTTYGRLRDTAAYEAYFACLRELIELIRPFYGKIDDVANANRLLNAAREPHFKPDHIQQIFWGNYFGPEFCGRFGKEKLLHLPAHAAELADGVYFTLTDSVFDAPSLKCALPRRKIKTTLRRNNHGSGTESYS